MVHHRVAGTCTHSSTHSFREIGEFTLCVLFCTHHSLSRERGAMRPMISLFSFGVLFSTVECATLTVCSSMGGSSLVIDLSLFILFRSFDYFFFTGRPVSAPRADSRDIQQSQGPSFCWFEPFPMHSFF